MQATSNLNYMKPSPWVECTRWTLPPLHASFIKKPEHFTDGKGLQDNTSARYVLVLPTCNFLVGFLRLTPCPCTPVPPSPPVSAFGRAGLKEIWKLGCTCLSTLYIHFYGGYLLARCLCRMRGYRRYCFSAVVVFSWDSVLYFFFFVLFFWDNLHRMKTLTSRIKMGVGG